MTRGLWKKVSFGFQVQGEDSLPWQGVLATGGRVGELTLGKDLNTSEPTPGARLRKRPVPKQQHELGTR